jgi:hypothetical protein
MSNTQVSDNGNFGVAVTAGGFGTTKGVLDHIQIENNSNDGLYVQTASQTINITVNDSVSANNAGDGIHADAGSGTAPITIMVRNSTIANNVSDGLHAQNSGAFIPVTRSTITGNGTGWAINGIGFVESYGDNNIDSNGSANSEPPGALAYH